MHDFFSLLILLMYFLYKIGKIIFSQFSELTNVWMNRGLPRNLAASDPSQNYSFKGVDITMASYMSELSFLASPVSTHMVAAGIFFLT